VRLGIRPAHGLFEGGTDALRRMVARAEECGIDRVCVGDHVSFHGGRGFDGLVQATALAVLSTRLTVATAVYLLPLRHPVPVARQVASLAALAPGRFIFGVGIGGDDRAEVELCGVDPRTRGRRMDESLVIVRALLGGETVDFDGEFFSISATRILPTPSPPVTILVGGRSTAALRRAGVHADGWLGLWVSPERFRAATAEVEAFAAQRGRTAVHWQHGLQVWCGFGASHEEATGRVAAAMEELYRVPFSSFERYVPIGGPQEVAEALAAYVTAGCRDFNLIPAAASDDDAVEAVAEVRRLLQDCA
jgi:alkanesulfonate monooxygenase SsuD/methylene tetrahydromethanopterin reductase-like flavin-dependent oxidoreductase (luciferase family)